MKLTLDEILFIEQYLDLCSLFKLAWTCKLYYLSLLKSDKIWLKRLLLQIPNYTPFDKLVINTNSTIYNNIYNKKLKHWIKRNKYTTLTNIDKNTNYLSERYIHRSCSNYNNITKQYEYYIFGGESYDLDNNNFILSNDLWKVCIDERDMSITLIQQKINVTTNNTQDHSIYTNTNNINQVPIVLPGYSAVAFASLRGVLYLFGGFTEDTTTQVKSFVNHM